MRVDQLQLRQCLAQLRAQPAHVDVERAVRSGMISLEESRQMLGFYESGLDGYTYLEEP